jgi:hypothetical protein
MFVFILILLLLASITGVLGAVLKVTVALFLSVVLAITLLIVFAWWMIRRSMRQYATGQHQVPGGGPAPGSPSRPAGRSFRGDVVEAEGRIKDDEPPQ